MSKVTDSNRKIITKHDEYYYLISGAFFVVGGLSRTACRKSGYPSFKYSGRRIHSLSRSLQAGRKGVKAERAILLDIDQKPTQFRPKNTRDRARAGRPILAP